MVVIVAATGFLVARHIYVKKRRSHPFVCPLNFDCHAVVSSSYSKVLGIPLEVIGMLYYAIIALSYLIFLILPEIDRDIYGQAVMFISVFAFLFSLYLTYIQAVKIKEWCSWCLFSAFLCTLIFFAVLGLSLVPSVA